jgi:exopolysaccharide biosynthesis polyprenyl glycosylphosphotransferase
MAAAPEDRPALWRDPLRRRMLAAADVGAGAAATAVAIFASGGGMAHAFWLAMWLPMWIVLAKLHGLYDRDHRALRHLTVDELPSLLVWAMTGTAAMALFARVVPVEPLDVAVVFAAWAAAASTAFLFRAAARFLWRRLTPPERVLVVGSGETADAVERKLELFPDAHARVIGRVGSIEPGLLGDADDTVDRFVVAHDRLDGPLVAALIAVCRRDAIKLTVVPPTPALFRPYAQLHHLADLPLIEYNTWHVARSTLLLKRVFDLVGAAAILLVLAPFLALSAVAIRLDSSGPVLFRQWRAGRDGRRFVIYKFRTMVADAEDMLEDLVQFDKLTDPMFKFRHDPRTTAVGKVLRRTSLDELPQLFNVLRGEMSLVGPRPEQADLADFYRAEHRVRLSVKPGLTGPMQVFGRGELTFEERLAVERDYIENMSLGRDLQILAMTLPAVVGGKGAF